MGFLINFSFTEGVKKKILYGNSIEKLN